MRNRCKLTAAPFAVRVMVACIVFSVCSSLRAVAILRNPDLDSAISESQLVVEGTLVESSSENVRDGQVINWTFKVDRTYLGEVKPETTISVAGIDGYLKDADRATELFKLGSGDHLFLFLQDKTRYRGYATIGDSSAPWKCSTFCLRIVQNERVYGFHQTFGRNSGSEIVMATRRYFHNLSPPSLQSFRKRLETRIARSAENTLLAEKPLTKEQVAEAHDEYFRNEREIRSNEPFANYHTIQTKLAWTLSKHDEPEKLLEMQLEIHRSRYVVDHDFSHAFSTRTECWQLALSYATDTRNARDDRLIAIRSIGAGWGTGGYRYELRQQNKKQQMDLKPTLLRDIAGYVRAEKDQEIAMTLLDAMAAQVEHYEDGVAKETGLPADYQAAVDIFKDIFPRVDEEMQYKMARIAKSFGQDYVAQLCQNFGRMVARTRLDSTSQWKDLQPNEYVINFDMTIRNDPEIIAGELRVLLENTTTKKQAECRTKKSFRQQFFNWHKELSSENFPIGFIVPADLESGLYNVKLRLYLNGKLDSEGISERWSFQSPKDQGK